MGSFTSSWSSTHLICSIFKKSNPLDKLSPYNQNFLALWFELVHTYFCYPLVIFPRNWKGHIVEILFFMHAILVPSNYVKTCFGVVFFDDSDTFYNDIWIWMTKMYHENVELAKIISIAIDLIINIFVK